MTLFFTEKHAHKIQDLLLLSLAGKRVTTNEEIALEHVGIKQEEILCEDSLLPCITTHFQQALRHRRFVFIVLDILDRAIQFKEKDYRLMIERVRQHNLSKFSAVEVLGFSIKLRAGKRELTGEEEHMWKEALNHHYTVNDHHPQHFQFEMDYYALLESLLKILAFRLDNDISFNNTSVSEIFDIPLKSLTPYSTKDRMRIISLFSCWSASLGEYVHKLSQMSPESIDLSKII